MPYSHSAVKDLTIGRKGNAALVVLASAALLVLAFVLAAPGPLEAEVTPPPAGEVDRTGMSVSPGGPPQQRHLRDRLCYGFPGCPDSFLFLAPALAVVMAIGKTRSVYALAGIYGGVFVAAAVFLEVSVLRVIIYFMVAFAVGLVWLAFGGSRR